MRVLVLAAFLIGLVLSGGTPAWPMSGPAAAAAVIAGWAGLWGLARTSAAAWERLGRVPELHHHLMNAALLGAYAALVFGAGWPGVVLYEWRFAGWVLVPKVLILLPFLGGLAALWLAWWPHFRSQLPSRRVAPAFPGEHSAGPPTPVPWTAAAYLGHRFRHELLLFLAPMLAFVALTDLASLLSARIRPDARPFWLGPTLAAAPFLLMSAVIAPELIIRTLPTRPLRDGPLREMLAALAERIGFRFRGVRVWSLGGRDANACVLGPVPHFRYVLLSDGLLAHLTPRQVAAVFAHEAGHCLHGHLIVLAAGVSAALFSTPPWFVPAWRAAAPYWAPPGLSPWWEVGAATAASALAAGAAFVFLSRRFERQADVFAVRSLCGPSGGCAAAPAGAEGVAAPCAADGSGRLCPAAVEVFADGLRTAVEAGGVSPDAGDWLHGSVAARIAFLRRLAADPKAARSFDVRLRLLQAGSLAAAAGIGVWALLY